jgi:hypothetical protein
LRTFCLALDKIRAEFKSDSESIAQSDAGFSAATLSSAGLPGAGAQGSTYRRASQIQIGIFQNIETVLFLLEKKIKLIIFYRHFIRRATSSNARHEGSVYASYESPPWKIESVAK